MSDYYICTDICKDYRKYGFETYEECLKWCYGNDTKPQVLND